MKRHTTSLCIVLSALVVLGASCSGQQDGGVFRSLDGGETWEQKVFLSSDGKKVRTINSVTVTTMAFHPVDANIIYLGTKENGLYITLSGGEQWLPSSITSGTITRIEIDPIDPNNIYVAMGSTIKKSADEGVTFDTIYQDVTGATIIDIVVDSFEHNRVYGATSGGSVVKSYDYGVNWDLRLEQEDSIKRLLMAKHDTRILYALTTDYNLYRTTTGGELPEGAAIDDINAGWQLLLDRSFKEQFENGHKVVDIAFDPNDTTIIYLVTRRGILKGTNNGTDWSDIVTLLGVGDNQNEDIRNLAITPGNSKQITFTLGHIIHQSNDGGETWKSIETFPSERNISTLIIDYQTPQVVYAGTEPIEKKRGLIKRKE